MKLRFEQQIALDREAVFRFHENPSNLTLLMEHWTAFRLIDHEGTIHPGMKMHVAERLGPFWIPMTFEHFLYEPPYRFGERQFKGPFRKCQHVHEFVETPDGTTIIDHLDVELPWWMGDGFAMRLLVGPRIRRLFAFRKQAYLSLEQSGRIVAQPS